MFDLPYLNTTKVSLQVKYENLLHSICMLVLQMQNFGMLDHSEKMELKIRKMTDICLYQPCWICHILIQQRSIIKSTLKIYSLGSLICCCICKILASCIMEKKMKPKIQKMIRNLPISAIFGMPIFNTTKVSRQVNFEKYTL